jgi:DNA-binding NarL/FixJ family response regulator
LTSSLLELDDPARDRAVSLVGRFIVWQSPALAARSDSKDVVAGLEAGADEYLAKPIDQQASCARPIDAADQGTARSHHAAGG